MTPSTVSLLGSRRALTSVARGGAVVAVVATLVSCSDPARLPLPGPAPVPAPGPARPVTGKPFPPLDGATTTYIFSKPLSYPVRAFTEKSSFVLYEGGGVQLQYEGLFTYRGGHERDGERIIFYFDETDSTPDAIGTLNGDLLEIRFSDLMQHSDFENAVYQRVVSDLAANPVTGTWLP